MTYVETPELTTLRFIESWRLQDPDRLTAELVSINKETNRRPDTYNFEIENALLIDPETKKPVLEFISPGPEFDIAKSLQSWASEKDEGLAYWVSPRLENVYPCEKIIIHRIAYTWDRKKIIQNSTILFDADLENPEELRTTFFTAEDSEENLLKILSWVESVSRQRISESTEENDVRVSASYFAEQIRLGVPDYIIVSEMQEMGFLGKNPISCPGGQTFSQFIDSKSSTNILSSQQDHMGSLEFFCENGHLNRRPYGQTIRTCTTCGASVAC